MRLHYTHLHKWQELDKSLRGLCEDVTASVGAAGHEIIALLTHKLHGQTLAAPVTCEAADPLANALKPVRRVNNIPKETQPSAWQKNGVF